MYQCMKSKKSRTSSLESMESILDSVSRTSPLGKQFLCRMVCNQWEDIIGSYFAQYTEPMVYKNGLLFVWVNNASLIQNLFYHRELLTQKINSFAGHQWIKGVHLTTVKKTFDK